MTTSRELRCDGKLHAILLEPDVLEVSCSSRLCGAGAGVVVRHQFRLSTQELIHTLRLRAPITRKEVHDASRVDTPVRTT